MFQDLDSQNTSLWSTIFSNIYFCSWVLRKVQSGCKKIIFLLNERGNMPINSNFEKAIVLWNENSTRLVWYPTSEEENGFAHKRYEKEVAAFMLPTPSCQMNGYISILIEKHESAEWHKRESFSPKKTLMIIDWNMKHIKLLSSYYHTM